MKKKKNCMDAYRKTRKLKVGVGTLQIERCRFTPEEKKGLRENCGGVVVRQNKLKLFC